VRDYRLHLQTVARRAPATINTVLTSIADFYVRRGLGAPDVARLDLPQRAPRALPARQGTRWLRAVQRCLNPRGASDILARLADDAGIDAEDFTSHVLRHTFGTILVRGGHDLALVAELMGHRRLETTRGYSLPSAADRERAINSLPTDR
jgi:integrase